MTKGEQLVERFELLTMVCAHYSTQRVCLLPEQAKLHEREDALDEDQALEDKRAAKAELLAYLKALGDSELR